MTIESTKICVSEIDAKRIAVAAFVGTALEWYDYFLFGTAAAIVFNRLYFTTLDPVAALVAAFATFGVGFASRPLGAVLFGAIGDRYGRRPALLITVVLIGISTGLIGFLPDYAAIGVAAPIMLALLRLLQGLAVGGEWGGAVTMALEHAPINKRGRFAALPQLGSPVGTLLSSAAFAAVLLLPSESFDAWGWRLPFLAAFPLLLVAVYMRRQMEESPIFLELAAREHKRPKLPLVELLSRSGGRLLAAIAASLLGVGGFYLLTTFVIGYGTVTLGLPRDWLVNGTLIAAAFQIFMLLLCGRLTERFGAGRMTVIGGITTAVVAFPVFWLVETGNPWLIALAITLGTCAIDIVYAAAGTLLGELFTPETRYTGVSLGYNVAGAISGFLPLLATALMAANGNQVWIAAVLLILVSLLTAVGGYFGGKLRVVDPTLPV